jgi:MerR family mercuric resistance operon transcriptional regulator
MRTRDPISSAQTPLGRGEVAALAGCNIETVRYDEQVGLLPAPARTASGRRAFA